MLAGTEHDTNLRRHKIDCLNTEHYITLQNIVDSAKRTDNQGLQNSVARLSAPSVVGDRLR